MSVVLVLAISTEVSNPTLCIQYMGLVRTDVPISLYVYSSKIATVLISCRGQLVSDGRL